MPSVLNDWVHDLTYMQQSVLLAMIRNADGIAKHHPQKELIKWFRRCILKSAFDGRHLTIPQEPGGGSFTGPVPDIERALDSFIWARDEMTLHYFAHSMHAFEILGYKYPHAFYRAFWHRAYLRCVDAMHMLPETEAMMDRRLCDNPETWMEREDKCGGCSSTERTDEPATGMLHDEFGDRLRQSPSDGAIYVEVSRKREDEALNAIAKEHGLVPLDAPIRLTPTLHIDPRTGENVAPREPIPLWAQVRRSDNRFVNKTTGLDLGNDFEIKWGHRKNEFCDYDETRDQAQPSRPAFTPGMNEISPFADSERGKLHDADAKGWNYEPSPAQSAPDYSSPDTSSSDSSSSSGSCGGGD